MTDERISPSAQRSAWWMRWASSGGCGRGSRMSDHVAAALDKMRAAGAHPAELAAMKRRLQQLDDPQAGRLPRDQLAALPDLPPLPGPAQAAGPRPGPRREPLPDLPRLEDLPEPSPERAREVLDRLAVVKLNGGLG